MSHIKKPIASLSLALLLLSPTGALGIQNRSSRAQGSAVQRRARARKDLAGERREKTFQLVWQTVNEENFDPTFGGVNWLAVYSRYAPRVARVKTDFALHMLLQQMLNEIPQSHFAIVPPENIPRIKSKKKKPDTTDGAEPATEAAETLTEEMESDNEVATQMLNGIGVDVRVLSGQVVLTRVDSDGPAAKAGLRPGFIIKSVDDLPLENVSTGEDISPELHMRLRQIIVVNYLGGEPGTNVRLSYLDEENKERQAVIKRERLKGALSPSLGNVPPLYTELETRRLPDNTGYIRFTVFTPQLAEKLCETIKTMRDAPGLVVDLRGNPGGVMGMASGIVGLLTNKTGLIGTIRTRSGGLPIPTFPQRSNYKGPLVVLIDRLSGSTAEVMAAALQESGRALIVGERSAGQALGANIKLLPTGALFEYARAGFTTSEGATLEGVGVKPDIEKKLDRAALLKGEDSQLQEAVRQIELHKESSRINSSTPADPPPPVQLTVTNPNASAPSVANPEQSAAAAAAPAHVFKSTPEADAIMERYIKAIGGREALERLKNRVSVGVCAYPFQDLTGKIVIYEQAPDQRSMVVDIPNLGVLRVVFDGQRGWVQNSLMGFYEYKGPEVAELRRDFDFYKITKYREIYSEMIYRGAIDSSQGRVEILEVVTPEGYRDELHFDAKTGLLVYGGGSKLGDYRQVGDVKVPFLNIMLVGGLEIKIQLQQVSHNVPISADAFAEPRSCFTGQ
ncbi:MAG TPA: S41 family peptidase [Pyrinomonadaceae bacterium]